MALILPFSACNTEVYHGPLKLGRCEDRNATETRKKRKCKMNAYSSHLVFFLLLSPELWLEDKCRARGMDLPSIAVLKAGYSWWNSGALQVGFFPLCFWILNVPTASPALLFILQSGLPVFFVWSWWDSSAEVFFPVHAAPALHKLLVHEVCPQMTPNNKSIASCSAPGYTKARNQYVLFKGKEGGEVSVAVVLSAFPSDLISSVELLD